MCKKQKLQAKSICYLQFPSYWALVWNISCEASVQKTRNPSQVTWHLLHPSHCRGGKDYEVLTQAPHQQNFSRHSWNGPFNWWCGRILALSWWENFWLVVSTIFNPSEKYESQSVGMIIPKYMESHQIPWFQTTSKIPIKPPLIPIEPPLIPIESLSNHHEATICLFHSTSRIHPDRSPPSVLLDGHQQLLLRQALDVADGTPTGG